MTTTLTRPHAALRPAPGRPAAYDLSGGRCAVEVVLAPFAMPVWRVRLRAVQIRLDDNRDGTQTLSGHVSTQPRYASLPVSAGWFMPATARSELLEFTAQFPRLQAGASSSADATIALGDRVWPADTTIRCLETDESRVVAALQGTIARQDTLPFPKLRLRIDAALELARCD